MFTNYLHKKDASVNNVAKALKQMNRDDALQILLDAVPGECYMLKVILAISR